MRKKKKNDKIKIKNKIFFFKKFIFHVMKEKTLCLCLYFKKFSLQFGFFSKNFFFYKLNNKLPIKYDDKPLPKWIIRSHKLNSEYKCHLCSGYLYRGLKSYYYHFFNLFHINKLFELGVKMGDEHNFVGITKIDQIIKILKIIKNK
nr:hypothetical protein Cry52Nrm1_p164 [Cryptomonas curvata]